MRELFGSLLLSALVLGGTQNVEGEEYETLNVGADCCTSDQLWGNCDDGGWLDSTYVWSGGDLYKSLGERITNINGGTGGLTSSPGLVTGFNTGFGLFDSKIRGQIGASIGVYDPRGRLGIVPEQNTAEVQTFVTAGLYKPSDMRNSSDPISVGAVVDYFSADDWGVNASNFDLVQIRAIFGYAISPSTEIGVWGTAALNEDQAAVTVAGAPNVRSTIRAMNQLNFYVQEKFDSGADLTGYVGAVDNAGIGDWQFGVLGQAPLTDHWSVFANSTYVVPSSSAGPNGSGEEQYNVGMGLVYYFGRAHNPGLPLLRVANNGSFLITD